MTTHWYKGELTTTSGEEVAIVELLGSGGQGEVFKLREPAGYVLKRYFDEELGRDPTLQDRLTVMVGSELASSVKSGLALAWPTDLVWSRQRFTGYLMPLIDHSKAIPIHRVSNPSDARRSAHGATGWARGVSWAFLVAAGANLAMAVHELHDAGVVIGDFNENNVLVWQDARITLLDCDSMQISDDDGRHFLCRVGRAEYTPPELFRADWANTFRAPSSDLFALAIHIHQLVMEGEHPFRGVWSGPGDKPSGRQLAAEGIWTGSPDNRLRPRPSSVSTEILTPQLQQLFERAFVAGALNPRDRPPATEWCEALLDLFHRLRPCDRLPAHVYRRELSTCPWCRHENERARQRSAATAFASAAVTSAAATRPQPHVPLSLPARPRPRSQSPASRAHPERVRRRRTVRLLGGIGALLVVVAGIGIAAAVSNDTTAPSALHRAHASTGPGRPAGPSVATTTCPSGSPDATVALANEALLDPGGDEWSMDISGTVKNTTHAAVDVVGASLTVVDANGDQLAAQYLASGGSGELAPGQTTTLDDSYAIEQSSSPPRLGVLSLSWDWTATDLFQCPSHVAG